MPKIVPRPTGYRPGNHTSAATINAIVATVTTGHAVELPIGDDDAYYNVYLRYRARVVARGYRFHAHRVDDHTMTAWATVP